MGYELSWHVNSLRIVVYTSIVRECSMKVTLMAKTCYRTSYYVNVSDICIETLPPQIWTKCCGEKTERSVFILEPQQGA